MKTTPRGARLLRRAARSRPARGRRKARSNTASRSRRRKELRELLRQGLQLAALADRRADDPGAAAAPRRRGGAEAAEAAAAQATSPRASATRSTATPRRGASSLQVEPGRAHARGAVELAFSGPAASDPRGAPRCSRGCAREWLLRAGDAVHAAGWEEAKRDAVRKLSSWRYAAARVAASRAGVDPETRSARLAVDPRQRAAVPLRRGRGARQQALPDAAGREPQPDRPGDPYDREALALYVQRADADRLLRQRARRPRARRRGRPTPRRCAPR